MTANRYERRDDAAPGDPLAVLDGREVILEVLPWGQQTRVSAVDAETGVEVVLAAPSGAAQHELERIAARKLARRLGLLNSSLGRKKKPAAYPRRGRLV